MSQRENELFVCTGSMGNARKGMRVSICMFIKKIKFLPVSTSHRKVYVKRVTSACIDMSSVTIWHKVHSILVESLGCKTQQIMLLRRNLRNALIMREGCASLGYSNVASVIIISESA